MSGQVECERHGAQDATFVCAHIAQTVDDGVARGFTWDKDSDGDHQSLCNECHHQSHALDDDEWDEYVAEIGRVLCLECFWRAWEINGKPAPGHHHH